MSKSNKKIVHEFEYAGTKCSLETGELARRSQASVVGQMGDTVVLATVNSNPANENAGYFMLSVEYIEKMYAGGLISSSRFVKRERFPSDEATLVARMIDRSVRCRFPSDYRDEVQVVMTVLSFDEENDPAIVSFFAASAALMLAGVPFEGPIAGVRVGYDGEKVIPYNKYIDDETFEEDTEMNIVMSTDGEVVTMIDADSQEVSEDLVFDGMKFGVEKSKVFVDAQKEFVKKYEAENGEVVVREYESFAAPKDLISLVRKDYKSKIEEALDIEDRSDMGNALGEIKETLESEHEGEYSKSNIDLAVDYVAKEITRSRILENDERKSGRGMDEVRTLEMRVGVLPRSHGSALFDRGGTQTLTITTLGSSRLVQLTEGMEGEGSRRYMHHYNAPGFTVGEAGRFKYIPGRREIGHGSLAEKALKPVIPDEEVFPYTIRVVSEIMSQEGSSSMASVCGSTLSLMDAGVPIERPVAGIAIGLVTGDDPTKDYKVFTDIADLEDFYGDMDFKVAGTKDGITAIQMDNKIAGVPVPIFEEALKQAKSAREFVLEEMAKVISEPRESLSKYAPKVEVTKIPEDRIGDLIGPGGKIIRGISEDTGAEIDVKEDGTVTISSDNEEGRQKALQIIDEMFMEPEVGKVYKGIVDKVTEYGAFVNVNASISGLVHISEMADGFVKDPSSIVSTGDEVDVMYMGDDEKGRVKLSMKKAGGDKKDKKDKENGKDKKSRKDSKEK